MAGAIRSNPLTQRCGLHKSPWPVASMLGLGMLFLYIRTVAPGVLGGDAGELQAMVPLLGLTHPTGYPLFILLGKVWVTLVPQGEMAWRLNLFSAVWAALAVGGLYRAVREVTGNWAALVGAGLLGVSSSFWFQAVSAEKYAFNAFLVVLLIEKVRRFSQTPNWSCVYRLSFVFGLTLTHHRSNLLFGLPLVLMVIALRHHLTWTLRSVLITMLLFLTPLTTYLYLFWASARGLHITTWRVDDLGSLWVYFLDPGGVMLIELWPNLERLSYYAEKLSTNFTLIGVFLGIVGVVHAIKTRAPFQIFALIAFIIHAYFSLNFDVSQTRRSVYFLPSFVIFVILIAYGFQWMIIQINKLINDKNIIYLKCCISMLSCVLLLRVAVTNYLIFREAHLDGQVLDVWRQNLQRGHVAERLGRALESLPRNAYVVGDWEQVTVFWYFQQIENLRPDITIIYPIERLDEVAGGTRPVFLSRTLPGIHERWRPTNLGPFIRLNPSPVRQVPNDIQPWPIRFGETIELLGYRYGPTNFRRPGVLPLTLYWRALRVPAADYSISLRLVNEQGDEVWRQDSQHPVMGTFPTSLWQEGEVVSDYYEIPLARQLAPGSYRWGLLVYRGLPQGGWENLMPSAERQGDMGLGPIFTVMP